MRKGRRLRQIATVRAKAHRLNEIAEAVCRELKAHEDDDVTVLDLDTDGFVSAAVDDFRIGFRA